MTPEQEKAILHGKEIQVRIDTLKAEQDKILMPVISQIMKADDPNLTMEVIRALPGGFHRTELRTHHISRMQDYEYRRRFVGSPE